MSGGIVADVTIIDPAAGMVTLDANSKLSRVAGTTLTVTLDGVSTVAVNDVGDWEKWSDTRYNTATFAGGCFWGLELLFQRIPGVVATKVGYTQGAVVDPSYEAVCGGSTGHTEAVAVVFDTSVASYNKLVADFIDRLGGDATKLNQVGNDRGTQYRHGIYAHSPEQLASASVALDQIEVSCRHTQGEQKRRSACALNCERGACMQSRAMCVQNAQTAFVNEGGA